MKTKTTSQILADAIEMVEPKDLRDLLKKALAQFLDEQIELLELKV